MARQLSISKPMALELIDSRMNWDDKRGISKNAVAKIYKDMCTDERFIEMRETPIPDEDWSCGAVYDEFYDYMHEYTDKYY
jgi:hypothetical protein